MQLFLIPLGKKIYKTLMICPTRTLLDQALALSTLFSLLLSLLDTALMLCIFIEHALPFTWNMFAVPCTWNIFLPGSCVAHLGTQCINVTSSEIQPLVPTPSLQVALPSFSTTYSALFFFTALISFCLPSKGQFHEDRGFIVFPTVSQCLVLMNKSPPPQNHDE